MVSLAADLVVEEPLELGVEAEVAWASRPGRVRTSGGRREDKVNFCIYRLFMIIYGVPSCVQGLPVWSYPLIFFVFGFHPSSVINFSNCPIIHKKTNIDTHKTQHISALSFVNVYT